jgi:hypothetical protein
MRKSAVVAVILLASLSWRSWGDSQTPAAAPAAAGTTAAAAPPAAAPQPATVVVPNRANKAINKLPAFTLEREAAALAFVGANHNELAKVIEQLRVMQPEQYEAAVRDLFATSERLTKIREQEPRRYPLELEAWKTKSRIQLLVARANLSEDPAIEQALREALVAQTDLRVAQLELQRVQMTERLAKVDADLDKLRTSRDREVQKQYDALLSGAKKARAARAK